MQPGWEQRQIPDNSGPGKEKRWGAPSQPPWVPKSLRLSPAQDQGAERRCAGRRARALRACERKCGVRVTAPGAPPGSVRRRAWVRVGWLASQASVFSSLPGTPGAAPALRYPGRVDSQESSQWAGGSRLSAPERGGVAGSPEPSREVTTACTRFRTGGWTGCLSFSRIGPPPGRKWPSHPKTDATCLLPQALTLTPRTSRRGRGLGVA